ncbi:MAG: hypothetical protein R3D70_09245 [Rhizobiaceae bacterium]
MNIDIRDVVERRSRFLIDEIRSGFPRYDHAVRFTLRSLSNYIHVGDDLGSHGIARGLRFRSRSAHDALLRLIADGAGKSRSWGSVLRNEHPDPLKAIWDRLQALPPDELSSDEVVRQLQAWPMVLVTIDEHKALDKKLPPFDRYREARVEVLTGDPTSADGWCAAPQFVMR